MNAPFGRTRGGEPDSPYNGFCTVFESESCPGRPASTSRPRVSPAARPDWMLGGGHGKAARAPALSRDDASVAEPRRRLGPDAGWEPGRGWAAGCRRRWWAPARRGGVAAGRRPDHGRRRRPDSGIAPNSVLAASTSSAQDCGARLNCTPLVSSPGLHLGARGRLLPARAPSAPAPEESPRSCATTSAVPPTSTSTAGTGLAIVCVSKTSNLVQSTTNLKMCNRTKSLVRGVLLPAASAPERCVHPVKPVIRHFGH